MITRDGIVITYINHFNPKTELGIWSHKNINNIWLSRNRKDYPQLNIKRRKVSDIIDNDRPEESYLKNVLLALINDDKGVLHELNY